MFDNIVDADTANTRERYEAAARAVRDILSAPLAAAPSETYARENPKRVYYLSMEFLIGRSLGNNVMNLLLDPIVGRKLQERRPRVAGAPRRGAGRGLGQWRARSAGRLLPRLDGHDAAAGDGLWPAL